MFHLPELTDQFVLDYQRLTGELEELRAGPRFDPAIVRDLEAARARLEGERETNRQLSNEIHRLRDEALQPCRECAEAKRAAREFQLQVSELLQAIERQKDVEKLRMEQILSLECDLREAAAAIDGVRKENEILKRDLWSRRNR